MEYSKNPTRRSFWKAFLLGFAAALAGNLLGWVVTLSLLAGLASDQVVEGFTWMTVVASLTLVPVLSLGYGLFASKSKLKYFRAGKILPWKTLISRGIASGVVLWLALGLMCYLLVTFQ